MENWRRNICSPNGPSPSFYCIMIVDWRKYNRNILFQVPCADSGFRIVEAFVRRLSIEQGIFDNVDIADENYPQLLYERPRVSETGNGRRPQIHFTQITHPDQFHVNRNMGNSKSQGNGTIPEWNEPIVRQYHGTSCQLWILYRYAGDLKTREEKSSDLKRFFNNLDKLQRFDPLIFITDIKKSRVPN